jgi:hypothetical protein
MVVLAVEQPVEIFQANKFDLSRKHSLKAHDDGGDQRINKKNHEYQHERKRKHIWRD